MAYWSLSGRLVFECETMAQMIGDHRHSTPLSLSKVCEMEVSAEFEGIALQLLAKEPGKRPPSAGPVRDLLAACPVQRPWTQERAADWWRKHTPETPEPEFRA